MSQKAGSSSSTFSMSVASHCFHRKHLLPLIQQQSYLAVSCRSWQCVPVWIWLAQKSFSMSDTLVFPHKVPIIYGVAIQLMDPVDTYDDNYHNHEVNFSFTLCAELRQQVGAAFHTSYATQPTTRRHFIRKMNHADKQSTLPHVTWGKCHLILQPMQQRGHQMCGRPFIYLFLSMNQKLNSYAK